MQEIAAFTGDARNAGGASCTTTSNHGNGCIVSAGASPASSCDEQVCVQNLVSEFRKLENQFPASGGINGKGNHAGGGENEAVESLLLLGSNSLESLLLGGLAQASLDGVHGCSSLKLPDGYLPEVSVNDVGDLLGDSCAFLNSIAPSSCTGENGNGNNAMRNGGIFNTTNCLVATTAVAIAGGEHDDLGTCSSSNSPLSTSSAGDQRVSNGTKLFSLSGGCSASSMPARSSIGHCDDSGPAHADDHQVVPMPPQPPTISNGFCSQRPALDFGQLMNGENGGTTTSTNGDELEPDDCEFIDQLRKEMMMESPVKDPVIATTVDGVCSTRMPASGIRPLTRASRAVEEEDRALLMACLPDRPVSAPPICVGHAEESNDGFEGAPRASLFARSQAAKRHAPHRRRALPGLHGGVPTATVFDMSIDHDNQAPTVTRSLNDLSGVQPAADLMPSFFVKRRVDDELVRASSRTGQSSALTVHTPGIALRRETHESSHDPGPSSSTSSNYIVNKSLIPPSMTTSQSMDIFGQVLPLADSPDLGVDDPQRIYVSDVFLNFFQKRHFDEFRSILETNDVKPVSIRPRGFGEAVDTITVQELHRLLADNQARADGFVRCLTLSSYDTDDVRVGDTVINYQERAPVELSSGIRTRRAQNEDIGYVELDGTPVPSLVVEGVHWVRIVDVLRMIVGDDRQLQGTQFSNHVRRIRTHCRRLNIRIHSCSPNDKARLVVVAHSFHNNSCLVLPALDAPRLIAYDRKKKTKPATAGGVKRVKSKAGPSAVKRSRLTREASSSGSYCSDSEEEEESVIVLDGDDFDQQLSPSVAGSVVREQHGHRRSHDTTSMTNAFRPTAPEGCARTRPFTGVDFRAIAPLLALTNPICHVVLTRSEPLMMAVCGALTLTVPIASRRGPPGAYHDHLFVDPAAECILCQTCHVFFDVRRFMLHFHAGHIDNGVLVALVGRRRGENPFDVWRKFNAKLLHFKMNDLARYVSPLLGRDKKTAVARRSAASRVKQMEKLHLPAPRPPPEPTYVMKPFISLRVKRTPSMSLLNMEQKRDLYLSSGIGDWIMGMRNDPGKASLLSRLYAVKTRG